MKGDKILFLFLGLFLLSLVSAQPQITLQNEEIQPGETIFATITLPQGQEFNGAIKDSDINFLEGRKKVFFEHDIIYFNGTYYFYAYTTREGNFTLEISKILYKDGDVLNSGDIQLPLIIQENIISGENISFTKILTIKPGFIGEFDDPNITLRNTGNSTIEVSCGEQDLTLEPQDSQTINVQQETRLELFPCETYKDFSIPIIRKEENTTIGPPIEIYDLKSDPVSIELNISLGGEPLEEQIQLFNFGDDNFSNIQITSDFDFIEFEKIENLTGREVANLTMTISPELPGHFEGKINISYVQNESEKMISIFLDFFILPEGSNETDFVIVNESCADLGGNICNSGTQLCNGTAQFTDLGEYCCPGNCIAKPSTGSSGGGGGFGWIIGLVIIAGVGYGAYYLYQRQKKMGPKKPEEQMKKTSEKLDERMKGTQEPKRVSGGIQRS